MNDSPWVFILATLLGAPAMWALLPGRSSRGRMAGVALGSAAGGLLASQLHGVGDWVDSSLFAIFAAVTLVAAVATVTMRNPVYCAVWLALSLLGTAALLFLQGAQFLGVATVVVYAGAILVTFLFVLMLADPEGRAPYDRMSWEAALSATAGAVIVGILTMTITTVLAGPRKTAQDVALSNPDGAAQAIEEHDRALADGVLTERHVARFGSELFGRHLVAVQVAGVLLLVALIGTAAIVAGHETAPQETPPEDENEPVSSAARREA
ncbi:MAG: NADH-quinone oxidoreductase subunit J [Planctomycetes bacterium]|nr:NADH-quinone oxidoreductase subunit J [Planctomycetota bacterium]